MRRGYDVVLYLVLGLAGSPVVAQVHHTEFSGTWTVVDSRTPSGPSSAHAAGRTLTVEQDAAMLRVEETDTPARGLPETVTFTYSLDGRPSRNVSRGREDGDFVEYVSYASWQGSSTLVIRTTIVQHVRSTVASVAPTVDVWTLRPDGQLVIEVTPWGGAGSYLRTVYRRK